MDKIAYNKLKMLDATHPRKSNIPTRLKVYYGWAKLNKVQKKEAIDVFFENEAGAGSEYSRSGKTLRKAMHICHERFQTEKEMLDSKNSVQVFTRYSIFMNDKHIKGSLKAALQENYEADKNHVSEEERETIRKKLGEAYLYAHPGYKEPEITAPIPFKD